MALRIVSNVVAALLIAGTALLVASYAPGSSRARDLCPRAAIVHGHTVCYAAPPPRKTP